MEVYHGSPIGGMKKIIPKVSFHGKPLVYATKKKVIAVLFLQKWNDSDFSLGTINDNGIETIYLTENYKDALHKIFYNKGGYLYTLDGSTFEEGKTNYNEEIVSKEEVAVIRSEKIENILLRILKYEKENKIKIFWFPTKPIL